MIRQYKTLTTAIKMLPIARKEMAFGPKDTFVIENCVNRKTFLIAMYRKGYDGKLNFCGFY